MLEQINGYTVGHAEVADLVAAWLREITTREAANDVIQDALKHGVPAIGMRCGSRVVCARAAKKWVKAGKALRSLFTTVHEVRDALHNFWNACWSDVVVLLYLSVATLVSASRMCATDVDICCAASHPPTYLSLLLRESSTPMSWRPLSLKRFPE